MIQAESKKIILSILFIAILIIAFVGVSYAAFTTAFSDSNENGISTGTITLLFDDNTSSVSMQNAMPISNELGKKLEGDGNVYDFTVHTNLSSNTPINCEISAEKIDDTQESLTDDSVRLYLQKKTKDGYIDTPITKNPQPFIPLSNSSFLGSKKGSMVLYSGTFSNTTEDSQEFSEQFRLRMWVAEDTIIDSVSRGFKIKLNVTAKAV